jgi:single-strand DNA-binding protein
MPRSINRVTLFGHVGRDPEIRSTATGTQVANFSLATNESYTDKAGNRVEKVEWHKLVAWGKLAEIAHGYLSKGAPVLIEGKLQTREWEDKAGQKRQTTEVVVSDLFLLGGKQAHKEPDQANQPNDLSPVYERGNGPEAAGDELPF